ncbi:tRNA (adenosine(37)-N6)-threonylcarbamoyltransferase complex ATPase subunit type 1 TsaE [Hymenobacter busanensis]|uniref:tRNA threonylcarbamoyladenosine biosynthesis protein TsaE n=1 Tax=Hymenobacter busanensis TaxID=2607656 RepID=A0A7L4ZUR4_9BACT|nr:tRNA (adenosine(37)-N6)-threonylcarbamoyltransferase complex ATPase subunit type 1 TsaE [Hymenobacter busanensis]KAA9339690.1 tRNA (adenosine(37)-N6)-threonylcarbamoyltransferase complex ATPase subunit type 1 TsaE [Hymenobacter busanensis]QHJ06555.1 tRNA (adenosine(37)-N6)-threonylcarbamoyltransferase complex ATPase subunit type 1 TsaE [Hymenobacter busanensis]
MLPVDIEVPTLTALPAAAAQLGAVIEAANCPVVLLEGEMGAGKTTLIRALCAVLGVRDEVSSPTFSLVNEYRNAQNRPVYHFDFYRIDSVDEALRIGAAEYFDSGYLCLIEWPSRVAPLLPPDRLLVTVEVTGPESRRMLVERVTE